MILGFLQNIGPWQLAIVVVVAFLLFGGVGKISQLARELGKAKNEFKKGLAEGEREDDAPAADSAAEAPKPLESKVFIWKGDKSAEAKKLMAVMGLGVKQNDEVKVTIEGPTEEADAAAVENFFKENF